MEQEIRKKRTLPYKRGTIDKMLLKHKPEIEAEFGIVIIYDEVIVV